jgi:hypothetical protein
MDCVHHLLNKGWDAQRVELRPNMQLALDQITDTTTKYTDFEGAGSNLEDRGSGI